jgi:hypothetical protein
LDSFIDEFGDVKFIKIDAEGGELVILQSGIDLIQKSTPIIAFELGNESLTSYPYDAADYFEFFSKLGYSIFSIFGLKLSREEFILAAEEQFFWDYVALPRGVEWTFGHNHLRLMTLHFYTTSESAYSQIKYCENLSLAKVESAELQAQYRVDALLSSSSWRLTAPLRWIASFIKKDK